MDQITELVYVISKHRPKKFDDTLPKTSKLRKLFDIVSSGKVKNDEEAAHIIYNSAWQDKRYLMLKKNLVKKLWEFIYSVDMTCKLNPNYYADNQLKCKRELTIAENLLKMNVYHNAEKILNKIYKIAKKQYLIDIQAEYFDKMLTISFMKGASSHAKVCRKEAIKYRKYHNYISEAKSNWEVLKSKLKYSLSQPQELIKETKEYIKDVQIWLEEYNNPHLKIYLHRFEIILNHLTNKLEDRRNAIHAINEIIQKFSFIKCKGLTIEQSLEAAKYYLTSGNLEEADFFCAHALKYAEYQAFDKFDVQIINFEIKIKQKKYIHAAKIFKQVSSSQQYELLSKEDKATWLLRKAFLYYIFQKSKAFDKVEKYTSDFKKENFAYQDFLTQTQPLNKDKQGYNILLQIIKLLFQAQKSKELYYEGKNLYVYYHRYLKDLNIERTKLFVKMLSKVSTDSLSYENLKEKGEELKNTLKEIKTNTPHDYCELIPYETLWDLISIPPQE